MPPPPATPDAVWEMYIQGDLWELGIQPPNPQGQFTGIMTQRLTGTQFQIQGVWDAMTSHFTFLALNPNFFLASNSFMGQVLAGGKNLAGIYETLLQLIQNQPPNPPNYWFATYLAPIF